MAMIINKNKKQALSSSIESSPNLPNYDNKTTAIFMSIKFKSMYIYQIPVAKQIIVQ